MIVGGYDLHLYCRFKNCRDSFPNHETAEFAAPSMGSAYNDARVAGWHFVKGDCICRQCWGKGRRHRRHGTGILAT